MPNKKTIKVKSLRDFNKKYGTNYGNFEISGKVKSIEDFNKKYKTNYTSREEFTIPINDPGTKAFIEEEKKAGGGGPGLAAMLEMHKKYGSPAIKLDNTRDRSFYQDDTINLATDRFKDNAYLSELAHHIQFKDHKKYPSQLYDSETNKPMSKLDSAVVMELEKYGDEKRYDVPGTVEYNAHKVIEPKLIDEQIKSAQKKMKNWDEGKAWYKLSMPEEKKPNWLNTPDLYYKKGLPKYGWGSTIGGVVGGIAGTLIAPGVGTGIGASLGSAFGNEWDQEDQPKQNTIEPIKNLQVPVDMTNYGTNRQIYAFGGGTGWTDGPNGPNYDKSMNPNAEVEGNEIMNVPHPGMMPTSTDGQPIEQLSSTSYKSLGSKHSNGGHDVKLPIGTNIKSDRLVNPLTGNMFSKDAEKIERAKGRAEKKLVLRPNDSLLKSAVKRLDDKSKTIFKLQEVTKQILGIDQNTPTMAMGGHIGMKHSYAYGGYEDPTKPLMATDQYPNYTNDPFGFNNFNRSVGFDEDPNYAPTDLQSPTVANNTDYTDQSMFGVPEDNGLDMSAQSPSAGGSSNFGNTLSNIGAGFTPTNVGLGLSTAGLVGQFANTLNPDPIKNISNPYQSESLNNFSTAVNNQRRLKYDVSDQIAGIKSSEDTNNAYINNNLSSGASRLASRLTNRGQSLNAANGVYGDRNRANIGIQTQANQMQQQLGEQYGRLGSEQAQFDMYNQDQKLRQKANMRNIRSSSINNAGTLFQQYGRDKELMRLLPRMFPNSTI